jgi:hypothetical protein
MSGRSDDSALGLERFAGRTIGVATMHGKERVIGPALMERLPLAGFVAIPDLDTDRFGSFSGEVDRATDPRTTCALKGRHGAEAAGMDLVIASEGSFVPYPPAPFMTCDEEWLVLMDLRDGLEVACRHVSLEARFAGENCTDIDQVFAFAARMGFPQHHLVLKPQRQWGSGDAVHKGIKDSDTLSATSERMLSEHGALWVESDLRAMANPTRMGVIREAAERFATELARTCPHCGLFHFAVCEALWGLPCSQCGFSTRSPRAYLRSCRGCGHQQEAPRPDQKTFEDPQSCDLCNP